MAALGVMMLRNNASSPMAPALLKLGAILPPCPWIKWHAMQTAATVLPCAVSPLTAARLRALANLVSKAMASAAVNNGGKSLVLATFAPAPVLPHGPEPGA